jgi:hypothetical protein
MLALTMLAVALNLNIGEGVHDSYFMSKLDTFEMRNPVGIVELEVVQGDWSATLRHMSSIPTTNDGAGINTIEFKYKFRLIGE